MRQLEENKRKNILMWRGSRFLHRPGVDLHVADDLKMLGFVLDWRVTFDKHALAMERSCNNHAHAIQHTRHLLTRDLAQCLHAVSYSPGLTTAMLCSTEPKVIARPRVRDIRLLLAPWPAPIRLVTTGPPIAGFASAQNILKCRAWGYALPRDLYLGTV